MKVGFIGAGNMGGALAKAVAKCGKCEIFVSDYDIEKASNLAAEINGKVLSNDDLALNCDFIFLGVKPQILPSVLENIGPTLSRRDNNFCLVTMAAGVTIESVQNMAGGKHKVIRIMPNTPVSVGEGVVLYCKSIETTDEMLSDFLDFIKGAGMLEPIPEELIDAGCAVSGCGPAFVYTFIEALSIGGIRAGLPEDLALKLAAGTVIGAGKMLLNSDKTPDELRTAVCSPGGSTIEGVKHLNSTEFSKIVYDAVKKSYNRTVELGKGK